MAFGEGGAEGGLVRVLKQADPLRTTGTGARGDAEAGGTQRSIGEAPPNVGASSTSWMNLRSAHSPKVMRLPISNNGGETKQNKA